MASTYTTSNRFTKQADGENANTWGQIVNAGVIDLMDIALDGILTVDVSAGNVTLTTNNGSSDQARYRTLKIIGQPGAARTITLPDVAKQYFIEVALSGTNNVTIKNTSDATGVTVSASSGNVAIVCDGTSTRSLLRNQAGTLFAENNLSDLNSASTARTNLGLADSSITTLASVTTHVGNLLFPIGSLYCNFTVGTNPGTLLGFGTWVAAGVGRMLIGAGTGTDDNGTSVGFTAGTSAGRYTVTLSVGSIPSHGHPYRTTTGTGGDGSGGIVLDSGGTQTNQVAFAGTPTNSVAQQIGGTGGGAAHDNMPPYVVVYYWRRTA